MDNRELPPPPPPHANIPTMRDHFTPSLLHISFMHQYDRQPSSSL